MCVQPDSLVRAAMVAISSHTYVSILSRICDILQTRADILQLLVSTDISQPTTKLPSSPPLIKSMAARSESPEGLELTQESLRATKDGILVAVIFGVIASLGIIGKFFNVYRRRRIRLRGDSESQQTTVTPAMMGSILTATMLSSMPHPPARAMTYYIPTRPAAVLEVELFAIPTGTYALDPDRAAHPIHQTVEGGVLEATPDVCHTSSHLNASAREPGDTGATTGNPSSFQIQHTALDEHPGEASIMPSRGVGDSKHPTSSHLPGRHHNI